MEAKRKDDLDFSMLPAAVRRGRPPRDQQRPGQALWLLPRDGPRAPRRAHPASPGGSARVAPRKRGRSLLFAGPCRDCYRRRSGMGLAEIRPRRDEGRRPSIRRTEPTIVKSNGRSSLADPPIEADLSSQLSSRLLTPSQTRRFGGRDIPTKPNITEASAARPTPCLESGTKALKARDFAAAAADLEKAAKLNPRDARIFSRLGAAWNGLENWDKASRPTRRQLRSSRSTTTTSAAARPTCNSRQSNMRSPTSAVH